ncbi:hypothetical protein [Streptomyces sp. NPDC001286]
MRSPWGLSENRRGSPADQTSRHTCRHLIGRGLRQGGVKVPGTGAKEALTTAPTGARRGDITASRDVETAVLLLVVGLIVSQLAARARRLEVITVTDAGYLSRIHRVAALDADAVVDEVRRELTELLCLTACRFQYGTLLGQPPRLRNDGSVTVGRRSWDVDTAGWPEGEIELRVYGNARYLGRFMLAPGPGRVPPLQARLVAATLADQTGAALDTSGPAG